MEKRIIYANPDNSVAIVVPSGEIPVEEVARKDIPAGTPYWIIDVFEVPTDREFRNAWELDASVLGEPDGIAIGQEAWSVENKEKLEKLEVVNDNN
jgi:hypothetical protein